MLFCVFFKMFAEDEDDKLRLAVMEFEDKSGKLSKATLSNATEYIRGAFVASNKYIVIAKERQENAIIQQMKKESHKLCNDKNCQIPLGQALSADTILRTTITFFAKKYTITSELVDLEKEATTKGAKATFNGSEESLNEALDSIVAQIVGKEEKPKENISQESLDKHACEYAKAEDNIETWEMYVKKFPKGECAFEAESRIERLKKIEENNKQNQNSASEPARRYEFRGSEQTGYDSRSFGHAGNQSDRSLERLTIHWAINTRPQGADCYWRVKSSTPDVKNRNERYLGASPYESTETFDIKGLTHNNAGNVQVEIRCSKLGYMDQKKVLNMLSVFDEKEISIMMPLVKEK